MRAGERQVAPTLGGIRRDHTARYIWAARQLPPGSRVIDMCCGVGYGAHILAEAGHTVVALDIDREAIAYARQHYSHPRVTFGLHDAEHPGELAPADAAVCFEAIEHLADPLPMLRDLRKAAPLLLASVPNESKFPFKGYAYHHRHYTKAEFLQLIRAAGFEVTSSWGQEGPESDVERDVDGRTLACIAERVAAEVTHLHVPKAGTLVLRDVPHSAAAVPEHVVILGLGPSLESYVDMVKRLGNRRAFSDEVWGINAVGDVIQCDRVFHLDDVRVQEVRAAAAPQSNIANMLRWMKQHPGPIYTSRIPEQNDYPGLVEYPLEDVITSTGFAYFNGTCAYAVAFAIHLGVKRISMYGCDFTYPNSHHAEKGRACVEWWLGYAAARGIELGFSSRTTLCDSVEPEGELYGYDAVTLTIENVDGRAKVTFTPRDLPSADAIERRYDHSRHPNPLVGK